MSVKPRQPEQGLTSVENILTTAFIDHITAINKFFCFTGKSLPRFSDRPASPCVDSSMPSPRLNHNESQKSARKPKRHGETKRLAAKPIRKKPLRRTRHRVWQQDFDRRHPRSCRCGKKPAEQRRRCTDAARSLYVMFPHGFARLWRNGTEDASFLSHG